MCHSPLCIIMPKGEKKMENGRKDIVEFLFSLQMQFNSIQRYEIEKKLNGK